MATDLTDHIWSVDEGLLYRPIQEELHARLCCERMSRSISVKHIIA